jgi:putative transposase
MTRTYKTVFITSKSNLNRLFECNRISAQVWNDCLKLAKEHDKQSGKWISKTELQKLTKGKYPIHSQSIQAVVHKYIWARDAAKKAREQGITTVKYPYKQKKNFNTKWAKDGFKIDENGKIEWSLG